MGSVQRHVVFVPCNLRIRKPSVRERSEILGNAHVEDAVSRSVCALRQVVTNDQLSLWQKE